jgi:flagellar biosynthetic protein FliR
MSIDTLMAFVLVLVRVVGIFAFLPIVGEGYAPQVVKALAAMAISLVLLPVTAVTLPVNAWDPLQFFLYVGAEALFGALMGLCALFIFKALAMAGELVGQQMGMALDFVTDPITGEDTSPVSTFCEVMGAMVFFCVGGHLWMIQTLHDSLVQWPLGAFLSPEFIQHMTVTAAVQGLTMAFQLAAPLLLLTFLVSLAMAVMARLVPEMNILIVGFPVKVGVGLIGLAVFVPALVQYCGDVSRVMVEFMNGVAAGG